MKEFLCGPDLWANIFGGVVAALLISWLFSIPNRKRNKTLKELIDIMGRAIQHRNIGEKKEFTNEEEWIQKAKEIEEEAVAKSKELSPAAGSIIEWLDRVPQWNNQLERYVSILSTVITRIHGIMERYSYG